MSSGTATLNGTLVLARGYSASCYFEYGLTTAYGSDTSASPSTCTTDGESFSYTLTGLTPGATYHYRAVAVSVLGTVYGSDVSFTLPIAEASVETVSVTEYGSRVDLVGIVNYDGGEACAVGFQYGCTTAYGSTKTHSSTKTTGESFTEILSGLAPDQTYHFRAFARNSHSTVYGRDLSFYIPPSEHGRKDDDGNRVNIGYGSAFADGMLTDILGE